MTETLAVAAIMALAGFVHMAAGFGSALVSMPLLSLTLGIGIAAPLQALCGLLVSGAVLHRHWRALDPRAAAALIAGSLGGVPFGLAWQGAGNEALVSATLGIVLLGYSSWSLLQELRYARAGTLPEPVPDTTPAGPAPLSVAVGFLAGFLGGAYNTDGPPVVMYGAVQRWSRDRFKSIVQSLFLLNGFFICAGHAVQGHFATPVGHALIGALPGLAAGMYLGRLADRRIDPIQFRRVLLVLLAGMGILLLTLR